jgi:hypothetical protein
MAARLVGSLVGLTPGLASRFRLAVTAAGVQDGTSGLGKMGLLAESEHPRWEAGGQRGRANAEGGGPLCGSAAPDGNLYELASRLTR